MSVVTEREGVLAGRDVERLVRGLERLAEREDRAALAALRRGLGKAPGEVAIVFPVLVPLLPEGWLRPWHEQVAYLIPSLFALHPASWRGDGDGRWQRNFGASLRQLADQVDSAGPERRFLALLDADADNVGDHLRGLVALLANAKSPVPVDWRQLTRDLLDWGRPDRPVQRRWADAFWPRVVEAEEERPDDEGSGDEA